MEISAAILALHHVRNMGHVAEPTPGAAMSSSVMLIVFTLVCSFPGVLPFTKHNSKIFQKVSRVGLTLLLCQGYAGLGLASAGGAWWELVLILAGLGELLVLPALPLSRA